MQEALSIGFEGAVPTSSPKACADPRKSNQFRELRVLVACEYSGTVRNAFLAEGHDAWSCDLRASEDGSNRHIRDDVRRVLQAERWDLLIVAHPPCTRLCNSGVRWLDDPSAIRAERLGEDFNDDEREAWRTMTLDQKRATMRRKLEDGAALFNELWTADVPHVACENPVMHKHARALIQDWRAPQYVQPWQFGDFQTKRTGLWLRGLEPLRVPYPKLDDARRALGLPADAKPAANVHNASPSADRGKIRSAFFPAIAQAMAEQWGEQALNQLEA